LTDGLQTVTLQAKPDWIVFADNTYYSLAIGAKQKANVYQLALEALALALENLDSGKYIPIGLLQLKRAGLTGGSIYFLQSI